MRRRGDYGSDYSGFTRGGSDRLTTIRLERRRWRGGDDRQVIGRYSQDYGAKHDFSSPITFGTIPCVSNLNVSERIRQAAEDGDVFAQFEVGVDFDLGTYGEQNFQKAAEYWAKAANQGHRSAEDNLLLQHVSGQVKTYQSEVVFTRFKNRAESGDRDAQNNLGLCFQFGYGTAQNYGEAAVWFRRSAEGGLATAQFNLGGLYYNGTGPKKDLAIAIEWYTRAAEQRHELALLQLGTIYQKGIGVEVNLERAAVLYLIAYKQGSVRAANHLGFMFRKGLGVAQDNSLAFQLYLESVNLPDTSCEIAQNLSYRGTANYWLGYMTENGLGTKRDLRAAKRWYVQGAACGQSNCIEAIARLSNAIPKRRTRKAVN
jgi:TPR repeat protein